MSRSVQPTDFAIDVEGVGQFRFARRSFRDQFRISAEYTRLIEGVENPNDFLFQFGTMFATLKVMTVSAPDGWDLESLDPLDEDSYANLGKVYAALRAKEDSFRRGKAETGKT